MEKIDFPKDFHAQLDIVRHTDKLVGLKLETGRYGVTFTRYIIASYTFGDVEAKIRHTDHQIPYIYDWVKSAAKLEMELEAVPALSLALSLGRSFMAATFWEDAQKWSDDRMRVLDEVIRKKQAEDGNLFVPLEKTSAFNETVAGLDFNKEIPDDNEPVPS